MLIFAKFNVFHKRPTRFDNYIAVHEDPEHITYFRTYRSAWMDTWGRFFFPLINILVCTIQRHQPLVALIKYGAYYHILYSGQLEIRLSVYTH